MLLVIDTWVLFKAAEDNIDAINLLFNIYKKCHKICVDKKNEIITEYRSVPGEYISWWLRTVYPRKVLKVSTKITCKDILGHKKDMKFVYVCLNHSSAKTIISEDHHFVNNEDELRKKGICLLNLCSALEACQIQS